ncbi:uncharacterized protein LOC122838843 isoform X1 [Gambusia affinis]|uniref:uncharacterized protein LOC122838843 isoform X1 n=2 Tax=Gambusia affinis TaxID=33528 RepID=UPI001CDBDFBB|nr:uncharacterized protein LOC122838843 isoform X1 [Gambusia affinis]
MQLFVSRRKKSRTKTHPWGAPVLGEDTPSVQCLFNKEMRRKSNVGDFRLGGRNTMVGVLLMGLSAFILRVSALEEPSVCLWPNGSEIKVEQRGSNITVEGCVTLNVSDLPGNFTSKDGTESSTNGAWIWIVVSCCVVLLLLIPLIWFAQRNRHRMFSTRSCWPLFKENIPAVPPPVTKQDATEVQWDLSWMEMSNLLDKQQYPGT